MDRKIPDFDFDFTPIGQAIKEARVAHKLTREQLAEESNYSDRHITSIENEGQFPSTELLFWLALKFNISLDQYLFPKKTAQKSTSCCESGRRRKQKKFFWPKSFRMNLSSI